MSHYDIEKVLRKIGSSKIRFNTFSTIKEISPLEWNALSVKSSPVMEWEYFYMLEESRCINEDRGFFPVYIGLYDAKNRLIGIAPMFERTHGAYEFGISGLITEISAICGISVGKGLVGTIPFTPVPAYRFLIRDCDEETEGAIWSLFLKYIDFICETRGLFSVRFYFLSELSKSIHEIFESFGYVGLVSNHYLWTNHYESFDQFLGSLSSHKRRNIRREIKKIREMGISIKIIKGSEANQEIYDEAYRIYEITWKKYMPFGIDPYLNPDFFSLLRPFFNHRCTFSIAERAGKRIGLALFYEKGDFLYGRYWGSFEEVPYLHFATCYYWPMIYAIEKGIKYIDPGFGGEHKALRGFKYIPVHHYIKFYGHGKHKCYLALERIVNNWL